MRSMAIAVVAAALLVPGVARGQAPAQALQLMLDEAIARGLAASHRIAEATARHDGLDAAVGQRAAAERPLVTVLSGYTRTNHVDEFGILLPNNQLRVIYPDVPDNYRARLDMAWPVYTGGRLESLAEAARRESAAATNDIEALRADLRLDIARAFWTLVIADESLRVVNESLARMGVHVRDVQNLLEAGLVPPNDVLSAQARESRQRMITIQTRTAREVAEAEVARLIGAAPGTSIQPVTTPSSSVDAASVESLVVQALGQRADRRALVARLGAADMRAAAAAAGKRPTIAIGGGVDYGRPNVRIFPRQAAWQESWDASVSVNWPLFDGGRSKAEMAEAAAGRRALQARLEELEEMTALELRQRLAEIESSRAVIAAAEDGMRAAAEAHRVVGERFKAGVATSTDVLDAQSAILQAGLDRVQALAGARLAEARLQRALGR